MKIHWPPRSPPNCARLADGLQRLHEYRRDDHEALRPVLRRLVAIERALGLREKIEAPRASRRRLGAMKYQVVGVLCGVLRPCSGSGPSVDLTQGE